MNVLDMFKLDGKTALVTGGAGRFGRQMVLALAQAGATVWTASRHLDSNETYAKELCKEGYTVYACLLYTSQETYPAPSVSPFPDFRGRFNRVYKLILQSAVFGLCGQKTTILV